MCFIWYNRVYISIIYCSYSYFSMYLLVLQDITGFYIYLYCNNKLSFYFSIVLVCFSEYYQVYIYLFWIANFPTTLVLYLFTLQDITRFIYIYPVIVNFPCFLNLFGSFLFSFSSACFINYFYFNMFFYLFAFLLFYFYICFYTFFLLLFIILLLL